MRFEHVRWARACGAMVVMAGTVLAAGCGGVHPTALVGTWRTNEAYPNMAPSPNVQSVVLDMNLATDGTAVFDLSVQFTPTATTSLAGCLEITHASGVHWRTDADAPSGTMFLEGTPIFTIARQQCPDPAFNQPATPSTESSFYPVTVDGAAYVLTNGTLTLSAHADGGMQALVFAAVH